MTDWVGKRIAESAQVKQALVGQREAIVRAGELLVACYRRGGKVLLFGNGGSACDALHIATELVGRFLVERPARAAIALPANPALLTALGNDYGYEAVFARQIEGLCRAEDVVIGLSTSGRSANVLAGLRAAAERGADRIGLCGADPGPMAPLCQVAICAPSSHTPRIQECHLLIGHLLCEWVDKALPSGQP